MSSSTRDIALCLFAPLVPPLEKSDDFRVIPFKISLFKSLLIAPGGGSKSGAPEVGSGGGGGGGQLDGGGGGGGHPGGVKLDFVGLGEFDLKK